MYSSEKNDDYVSDNQTKTDLSKLSIYWLVLNLRKVTTGQQNVTVTPPLSVIAPHPGLSSSCPAQRYVQSTPDIQASQIPGAPPPVQLASCGCSGWLPGLTRRKGRPPSQCLFSTLCRTGLVRHHGRLLAGCNSRLGRLLTGCNSRLGRLLAGCMGPQQQTRKATCRLQQQTRKATCRLHGTSSGSSFPGCPCGPKQHSRVEPVGSESAQPSRPSVTCNS